MLPMFEPSGVLSSTLPASGMWVAGLVYELPMPVLRTVDSVSSSLPTPRASRGASGTETMYALGAERSDENRPQGEVLLPTPEAKLSDSGPDYARSGREGSGGDDLITTVFKTLLPTPAANDSGNTPENHLRKKPGRSVVTSLMVLVDHDLLRTGGRIDPLSNDGNEPPDE